MKILKCDVCGKADIEDTDDLYSAGDSDLCEDCYSKINSFRHGRLDFYRKIIDSEIKAEIIRMQGVFMINRKGGE